MGFGQFVPDSVNDGLTEIPPDPSAPPPGFSVMADFGPAPASVAAANEGPVTE